MNFGEWLKSSRNLRGWTLQQLADKAETTHPSISRLENNRANPSRKMILRIAAALGVDPAPGLKAAGFTSAETGERHEITRVLDPEMAEVVDAFEGMPEPVRKAQYRAILETAREFRRSHPRNGVIGGSGTDIDESTEIPEDEYVPGEEPVSY